MTGLCTWSPLNVACLMKAFHRHTWCSSTVTFRTKNRCRTKCVRLRTESVRWLCCLNNFCLFKKTKKQQQHVYSVFISNTSTINWHSFSPRITIIICKVDFCKLKENQYHTVEKFKSMILNKDKWTTTKKTLTVFKKHNGWLPVLIQRM